MRRQIRMTDAVDLLVTSLHKSRETLNELRIRGPRHFFLWAMAGYLWSAIAASDTLLAVIRSRAGQGAAPLKRFLHESYLDVMFLSSDPDSDLLAAKTLLSELRDSVMLLNEYREVRAAHPEADLPIPSGSQFFDRPVGEFLIGLDEQNKGYGGSDDLFTRAWASWEKSKYWHWSGLSRKRMIDVLVERGKLHGRGAFIALSLTRMYNAAAHAAPTWAALPDTRVSTSLDTPKLSTEGDLTQLAVAGHQFLEGISREVRECFVTFGTN
jgi:hypothetical protein